MGTPNTMHRSVLAVDVRRLSQSASWDAWEVISEPNRSQGVRRTTAMSGSSTNAAPAAAGA